MAMHSLQQFKVMFVPVLICFEPKCREANKSTMDVCSKEPLEETPQEAEGEELAQSSHLFPVKEEHIFECLNIYMITS